ncbi:CshA/CshB family fibrillar adhesin-related protein [Promicromonospora sukumoe]
MRQRQLNRNRRTRASGAILLVAALLCSLLPLLSTAPPAAAATNANCSTADEGSGRYASTLCWFDFSGYDPAQAMSAEGQDVSVALPGGSTLTFILKASGGQVRGDSFPTYSAAYLGNGSYTGVGGRPALYQTGNSTTSDLVLSRIALTTAGGERSTAFSLVGADAESTDANESIAWNSSDPLYSLTAEAGGAGIGNACARGYSGLGTRTVTCSGAGSARKTGTAIVASQAPDTFSQRMVGGGRQAVAFGVLLSRIELDKEVGSRFTGDAFEVAISDEAGNRLFDASTGPTGTSATTGQQTVLTTDRGATFRFSERATSGTLDRYDETWSCTRNGQDDPTLPSGREVGPAADVHLGIGDFVSCTITNTAKPTSLLLQKRSGDPDDVNVNGLPDVGDLVRYTFDVTNTGDLPVEAITVDDPKIGTVTCPAGTLELGETVTCTADELYTVTAEDQADGSVDNTATASGTTEGTEDPVTSNESSTTTPLTAAEPAIALTKIATPHDEASFVVDQEIAYSFVVTNTGNVPLDDVTVDEAAFSGTGDLSAIDCPGTRLEPDRSMTCTATYTLTQGDIDATRVTNTAQATGRPVGGGDPVSADDSAEIPGVADPLIGLEKSVEPETARAAGETVEYTFHVINQGNITLTDPQVTETAFTGTGEAPTVSCPAGPLPPGAAVDCTALYTLTQDDVDAGVVDNAATATATPSAGDPPVSEESTARVTIPETNTGITILKSADTSTYTEIGQTVTYTFEVTNTGNRSLDDVVVEDTQFTGSGELADVVCPARTLGGGASMSCSATYEITQADLDAGTVYNAATASGTPTGATDPISTAPSDVTITAEQQAAISLVKTADPTQASQGDQIQYVFRVTNTGNVTLADPRIDETEFSGTGELSDVSCPTGPLAPGASVDCTGSYTVTAADRTAEIVENTAVATARPPVGVDPPRSNESSASVRILNPAIALEKAADRTGLSVDDTITYTFKVTNTGNVPLQDVTVAETRFTGSGALSAVDCPETTASLAPGDVVNCTATYRVTQDDVDAGSIDNTAVASGAPSSGDPVESDPSAVRITEAPVAGLSLLKTADLQRVTRPGQVITYSFVLTNTGSVTLTNPTVQEQEFSGRGVLSPVTCPADVRLLPGESITCTATYEVVAADLTGGPLTNVATGTAVDPHDDPETSPPSREDVTTERDGDLANTGFDAGTLTMAAAALVLLGLLLTALPRLWRRVLSVALR